MSKKDSKFYIVLFLLGNLFLMHGCIQPTTSVKVTRKKFNTNFSISQARFQNHQLVINGLNLENADRVVLKRAGFEENFQVETKSATEIIANGSRSMSIAVGQVFDLIISNAQGAATFQVSFTLDNHSVELTKLDDTGASAGQVLKFNGVDWVAANIMEAQIYMGTWNASNNIGGVPDLSAVSPTAGEYYIASAAGTLGGETYAIGDWIISDGFSWQKVAASKTSVTSFQGRKGIVTLTPADYVSLKDTITQKITGSSIGDFADIDFSTAPGNGQVLTYSTAGGLNKWIPGAAGSGGITLSSLSGSAPITYNSTTGAIGISAATTSDAGSLSAADKTSLNTLSGTILGGNGIVERFNNILAMKNCGGGEMLIWYAATGWTCTTSVTLAGSSAQSMGMSRNSIADTAGNNLTLQASGATLASTDKVGGNLLLSSGTSTGSGSSTIQFQTANSGASGTADNAPATRMSILGNGNVGIGTTSPASKLHIGVDSASSNYGTVSIGAGAFNGSTAGYFGTTASSNPAGTVLAINAALGYVGDLVNFQVGGSPKFRVNSLGDVTIAGQTELSSSQTLTTANSALTPASAPLFANQYEYIEFHNFETTMLTAIGGTAGFGTTTGGADRPTWTFRPAVATDAASNYQAILGAYTQLTVGAVRHQMNWSKRKVLSARIMHPVATAGTIRLYWGPAASTWAGGGLTVKGVGFEIINNVIYAVVHDGTTKTTSAAGPTLSALTVYNIVIDSNGAGGVNWWVNGVAQTAVANGPTGLSLGSAYGICAETINPTPAVGTFLSVQRLSLYSKN